MNKSSKNLLIIILSVFLLFSIGIKTETVEATSSDFEYEAIDSNSYKITNYKGAGGKVKVPATYNNRNIVEIGAHAFREKNITHIELPNTIETISVNAFFNNKLERLVIPDSVRHIGHGAFRQNKLIFVYLPDKPIYIGEYAFSINELNSIEIPRSIEEIKGNAFEDNNLYVIGWLDSAAHYYALDNGIPFSTEGIASVKVLEPPKKLDYVYWDYLDLKGLVVEIVPYNKSKYIANNNDLTYSEHHFRDTGNYVYGKRSIKVHLYPGIRFDNFDVYYNRFTDVKHTNSFYDYVHELVAANIIKGYDDGTFRPGNSLTRAQAAKMIVLAAGINTSGASSNFKDVKKSASSYEYISAAYEAGIISGYSDGTFKPNDPVKRSQIAKMVTLAFNLKKKGNPPKLADVEKISNPTTREYIYTLSSLDIVKGYADGTFKPYNNVTRGQFSKIVRLSDQANTK